MKIKWESKKLKIRCFLCIWRLATYVIILYKPYSLSGYCDNWISQSKNISENILRDYSDFDLFVIHNRFVSKKIHSFGSSKCFACASLCGLLPLLIFSTWTASWRIELLRPLDGPRIFVSDAALQQKGSFFGVGYCQSTLFMFL